MKEVINEQSGQESTIDEEGLQTLVHFFEILNEIDQSLLLKKKNNEKNI